MKHIHFFSIILLLSITSTAFGQTDSTRSIRRDYPQRKLTIEPAIGIHPMPTSDVVLSNLLQWNIKKRLSLVSRAAVSFNTAFARKFNYVETDYSYTLSKTFGIGTSFYQKNSSHTFSLMAGIKYDATKETLNNPEFEKVSVASSTVSPDLGLMYHLKLGRNKYFFSYRMYIPLYPYPFKTLDKWAMDGNFSNVSMEFGVGVRIAK